MCYIYHISQPRDKTEEFYARIKDQSQIAEIHKISFPNASTGGENTRDLLGPQLKEKNIEFVAAIAPDLPLVNIDPSQIERVLINLIGNAIKFTPESGRISVRASVDDENVSVAVSDTGIGMNEGEMTNLFTEFYRVENAINQNVKGSGLGLVLAKNIIEAHGGKMTVNSISGQGSTFTFTLPLIEPVNS